MCSKRAQRPYFRGPGRRLHYGPSISATPIQAATNLLYRDLWDDFPAAGSGFSPGLEGGKRPRKHKDPTNHGLWNPPLFWAVEPECRILVFVWSLAGPTNRSLAIPLWCWSTPRPPSKLLPIPARRWPTPRPHIIGNITWRLI